MPDAISSAQLGEQHVELLPARTVLSMLHGAINGPTGDSGTPGTPGANGQGISRIPFLWTFGWDGSDSSYSQAGGDSGSSANGSHG